MSIRRIHLIMTIWLVWTSLSAFQQLDRYTGFALLPALISQHMTAIHWTAGISIAIIGMPHLLATFVAIIALEFSSQLAGQLMVASFQNQRIFHRYPFANHELNLLLFVVALLATIVTLFATRRKAARAATNRPIALR